MSRIAKYPVVVPSGVEVKMSGQDVSVKGGKGSMSLRLHDSVAIAEENGELQFSAKNKDQQSVAMAGTMRSLCLLYTSPSPRDLSTSRMPSSA